MRADKYTTSVHAAGARFGRASPPSLSSFPASPNRRGKPGEVVTWLSLCVEGVDIASRGAALMNLFLVRG